MSDNKIGRVINDPKEEAEKFIKWQMKKRKLATEAENDLLELLAFDDFSRLSGGDFIYWD